LPANSLTRSFAVSSSEQARPIALQKLTVFVRQLHQPGTAGLQPFAAFPKQEYPL
jgi:hypothetical protein